MKSTVLLILFYCVYNAFPQSTDGFANRKYLLIIYFLLTRCHVKKPAKFSELNEYIFGNPN